MIKYFKYVPRLTKNRGSAGRGGSFTPFRKVELGVKPERPTTNNRGLEVRKTNSMGFAQGGGTGLIRP